MNSYYTVFTGKDHQIYFNLKAGNHEIILQSEGYTSTQGAINGINSVQDNCTDDAKYKRKTSKKDEPYFVLTAQNGEIIGVSEMYSSTQMMEKGVDSVKANGITTKVNGVDNKTIKIHLNKELYKATKESMSGSEILNLASLSHNEYSLFLVKGNSQKEISYDQIVDLSNGMHFQAIISEIKFG